LSGGQEADRGGLTRAGRALEKHGGREGSKFPKATGNVGDKNAQGQEILDDIGTNPSSTVRPLGRGGWEVRDPSGRGARFNKGG